MGMVECIKVVRMGGSPPPMGGAETSTAVLALLVRGRDATSSVALREHVNVGG